MIYLLWGLLNIGLLIYFLIISFKVIKLIREKLGLFETVFFVIILLSLIGSANKDSYNRKTNSNGTETWTFTSKDSISQPINLSTCIVLEKNLISKYQLDVIYGKDKKGMNCPVSAFSSTNGFILGTNWKAESIMVSKTNDNQKFQYIVNGIVEWHLLGITIYTQAKTYKGTISTIKIGR